jgi:hypothetical protein
MVTTGPVARLVVACAYGKLRAEREPLGPGFRTIRASRP